jgi:hypothetical protein
MYMYIYVSVDAISSGKVGSGLSKIAYKFIHIYTYVIYVLKYIHIHIYV